MKIILIIFILFSSCIVNEDKIIERSITINLNNDTDYNASVKILYPFYDNRDSYGNKEEISIFVPSHSKRSVTVNAKWLVDTIVFVYYEEESINIYAEGGNNRYFSNSYTITSETSSINVNIIF